MNRRELLVGLGVGTAASALAARVAADTEPARVLVFPLDPLHNH